MISRIHREQEGAALVTVIGVTFFLTLLLTTLLVSVINVNTATYRDADFHAALGAAEAGIDELVYHLNADPYYWEKIAALDPAVPGSFAVVTPAFSGWTPIPGGTTDARFRYDAVSNVTTEGTIELVTSGQVGERIRTLDVVLRRRNFLDYLYFTEYETRPPAAYNTWPPLEEDNESRRFVGGAWVGDQTVGGVFTPGNLDGNVDVAFVGDDAIAKAEEQCSHHRYGFGRPRDVPNPTAAANDPNPDLQVPAGVRYVQVPAPDADPATVDGRNPKCHEPHWTQWDQFTGPLHTNDAFPLRDDGGSNTATFNGPTATSSWFDAPPRGFLDIQHVVNGQAAEARLVVNGGQNNVFVYDDPLRMPPSNDQLMQLAVLDGCRLYGPTRLHLHRHGTRAYIGVNSPLSRDLACGSEVSLDANGQGRVPVDSINNGVLFVANAAQDSCTGTGRANGLPMEAVGDYIPSWNAGLVREDVTPYTCWHGDALLSGELEGRLTIGAGHDVIIVGNVTYRGVSWPNVPNNDETMLGIVANRFIYLFNPVECYYWWDHILRARNTTDKSTVCLHGRGINYNGGGGDGGGLNSPIVYGALLSVQYSMTTQNSGLGGSKGQLRIMGAIAQRYRGNLGTANGYYLTPGIGGGQRCWQNAGSHAGVTQSYCSAGYTKDFRYDTRLRYLSPPHFLSPLETSWGLSDYSETEIATFAGG